MKLMTALFLVLISCTAVAQTPGPIQPVPYFTPEDGWWVIKDRPGSGFAFERQGNPTLGDVFFVAFFTYDADGRPSFYTSTAPYNVRTQRAEGVFTRTSNGQVFDSPNYVFPDVDVDAGGPAVFQFDSPTTGRWLSTNQGEVEIVRSDYAYEDQYYNRIRGRWLVGLVESFAGSRPKTRLFVFDYDELVDLDPVFGNPESFSVYGETPYATPLGQSYIFKIEKSFQGFDVLAEINDTNPSSPMVFYLEMHHGFNRMVGRFNAAVSPSFTGNAFAYRILTFTELQELRESGLDQEPADLKALLDSVGGGDDRSPMTPGQEATSAYLREFMRKRLEEKTQ